MEFLSSYFFRLRVSNDDAVTFGLYPKWGQYVTYLAQLLSHLASSAILTADTTNQRQSGGDAEQGMKKCTSLCLIKRNDHIHQCRWLMYCKDFLRSTVILCYI